MQLTDLVVIGHGKWGQNVREDMYRDRSGRLFVKISKRGTLRKSMLPYRIFSNEYLHDGYIIERRLA